MLKHSDILVVLLAGGRGSRLEPLTRDRAKPAVPFGGIYRIIDFTLSNCINSGLRRIFVLTQYKAQSLERHVKLGWSLFSWELGEFIDILPPQQRIDEHWYKGTADAVYQNIYSIEPLDPAYVLILAGDHIYKMNYWPMIQMAHELAADAIVGCLPVPVDEARRAFGVLQIDTNHRVIGFEEKPEQPQPLPDNPSMCLASMGIYCFPTRVLFDELFKDAGRSDSQHDFGRNVIPSMIDSGRRVYAYQFVDENRKSALYWRDVGTVDSYFAANMDLVAVDPLLNLYDRDWPIRTYQPQYPPAKFVFAGEGPGARRGEAIDSIVAQGCIISGGHVYRSVLSPAVRVNSYAHVEECILFEGVNIGRHCVVRRAIIDKGVHVPPGTRIGIDPDEDRRRGFHVTPGGIVVLAKHHVIG